MEGKPTIDVGEKDFGRRFKTRIRLVYNFTGHNLVLVRDSGFGIRDSGFGIRDEGIRDSGFGIRDEGIRDSRRRGSGFGIRDSEFGVRAIRIEKVFYG